MIARIFVSTWYWLAAAIVVGATAVFFAPAVISHTATPGETEKIAVSKKIKVAIAPEEAAAKTAAGLAGAPQAEMRAESTIANAAFNSAPRLAPHRQLARSASLSLIVGNVDRAVASMTYAARSFGGDVVKLEDERPAAPGERHTAQATLSVPERSFDTTLKRLAALGGVRSQSIAAEDVGDQIVDATARLRNLRRTEVDLLGIMDRSGRISEVLDVQNQLSDVRDRIERLDAETHALSARVAFATIEVSLEDEAPVAVAEPSSRSLLGAAWGNAWHASRDAAIALVGRSFMILAFAPYWLALLALGLLLATQARRRFGTRASAKG